MKDSHAMQITFFDISATQDLTAIREAIWQRMFALYEYENLREDVLGVVRHYIMSPFGVTCSDVVANDAKHVLPFLESVLDSDNYRDCALIHDCLDLLERHGVEFPQSLQDQYRNDTYALAKIRLSEWFKRREQNLSWEEHEQYKRDLLEKHTADYTLDDYAFFFERCLEIRNTLDSEQKEPQLRCGVENALLLLAERDPDLYEQVLQHYLSLQDPFQLYGHLVVQKLIQHRGYDATLHFLGKAEFPAKQRWLFHVYEVLPSDAIDEERLGRLYDLYRAAEPTNLPRNWDYLLKYLTLDSRVVAKVVSAVLEKTEKDPNIAYALEMLFNPYKEVTKRLLDLLKLAYLLVEGRQHHTDYAGKVFDCLLDLDPTFVEEYIAWKYGNAESGGLRSRDDYRDYTLIWIRPDHQEIMDKVIDCVFRHEKDLMLIDPYLRTFFRVRAGNREADGEVREKQDAYLLRLIDERSDDAEFMEYLFGMISQFAPERRRKFVERFVQRNRSLETFKRLPLESRIGCSWGSRVPMLQRSVDYWEWLLPILNTVDLLPHKQYVERRVQGLRAQIEREKKSDFIED